MPTLGEHMKGLMDRMGPLLDDYVDANVETHAASTAYFFFMSLIPLVIIIAHVVSRSGITEQDVVLFANDMVPDALNGIVTTMVREAYRNSAAAATVSVATLVWTASQGSAALARGLNAAYHIEEDRTWFQRTFVSLASVVVLIALLAAAMYLIFSGGAFRLLASSLPEVVEPDALTTFLRTVVLFACGITIFALCYTFLPAGRRRLAQQLPGAVLAAVAWFVFSFAFRVYIDHSTRFTLYGSVATVAIFLFWLFGIFFILLLGGLVNRILSKGAGEAT